MLTFPCLRCGAAYPQVKRHASYFCASCRLLRRREREAERSSRNREAARNVRAMVDTWVSDGDIAANDAAASIYPTLAQYGDAHDERSLVMDRMPAHSNSPLGPDEGMSVARGSELAGVLDGLAKQAAGHLWWQANPNWAFELHDPDAAEEHLHLRTA